MKKVVSLISSMRFIFYIAILFVVWKVLLNGAAYGASFFIPLTKHSLANNFSLTVSFFYWIWANFDGVNYIQIARNGYQYPNFAFFPLFPILISFVNQTFRMPRIESGVWVSSVAFFLALIVVYKTVLIDFSKNIAQRTIIFLFVFPTAFYYGAVYADSLFLLLSTLSFYFARKSFWFWAGIFGFLASLDRLVGGMLFLALLVEWYLQNEKVHIRFNKITFAKIKKLLKAFFRQRAFFLFLVPLGIVSYAVYLKINFGDFLLFQKSMVEWHQSQLVFPLQVAFRYIKIFLTAKHDFIYFVAVLEFVATILYLWLSVYVLRKVRISYGVFMLLVLLLPTLTGTFQSMPRYMLHLFPGFIGLALLTSRSKKKFWITVGSCMLLQLLLAILFTRGYFVA